MKTRTLSEKFLDRNGILYPMLVIAAVSVILFSLFGMAMMLGLFPRAEPTNEPQKITQSTIRTASDADKNCGTCDAAEAVYTARGKRKGSVGSVAESLDGQVVANR